MAKSRCKRTVAIIFYLISLLTLMVSIERLVFDVFGQMWGTMLVNGMNLICTLIGIMGTCIRERIAIAVYLFWCITSIGLNIVIVLIYQDVGLLSNKEHYLGLTLGNDNWWRTHGVNCDNDNSTLALNETVDGSGIADIPEPCVLSYVNIETIHAAVYMFLTVISVILVLPLFCSKREKKTSQGSHPHYDDEEDFSFVSIGQCYDYPRANRHRNRWQHSLGTNKTTV